MLELHDCVVATTATFKQIKRHLHKYLQLQLSHNDYFQLRLQLYFGNATTCRVPIDLSSFYRLTPLP